MKGTKKTTGLSKTPTGIQGLDEILFGGLPSGRPTLVCGNAGCGKTILAMQFLINGVLSDEPGLFVSFEENSKELKENFLSLGFDLDDFEKRGKIVLDHVHIERQEIKETGEFDLEGLFIRLGHAIDSIGAKRIVLDTIEALFSGFNNEAILRAELRRLFRWLKKKDVTAIVTGECPSGEGTTRHGLEEFVADCVIVLNHQAIDQIATRRLRVVKYRGSTHGTNQYPFLIDKKGFSILPVTSMLLEYKVSQDRVSTGVHALDLMLEGKGYFRGSSILISGSPGSGKITLASHFMEAACKRGEKGVLFSFEESEGQLVRNMMSVGIDLGTWIKKGLLRVYAKRPSLQGLELHLLEMHNAVSDLKPQSVVIDPISGFSCIGNHWQITSMLARLVGFLKEENVTAVFTDLISRNKNEQDSYISSLCDTWMIVTNEDERRRQRTLSVVKSRGMGHSEEIVKISLRKNGFNIGDLTRQASLMNNIPVKDGFEAG